MTSRLVGHGPLVQRLAAMFARGRLAHAMIFAGPDGIGKCLAARAFAASLFCEAPTPEPCGECPACRQVAAGTHPDLLLVAVPDGKRDIGVDQVRTLKRSVHIRAVSGRGKVAIVNEAERLTPAAQNALLKTLEEPPAGVFLVLVTASPDALLSTVRSRCQRIPFPPLSAAAVAAILRERHGVDAADADALAAAAEGSAGRALRLRELWSGNERVELLTLLADLDPARYVSILRMSKALSGTEPETVARLDVLLGSYRDAAVAAVVEGESVGAADFPLRAAAHVARALRVLQRRNPNRALLLEALALRLAKA